MSTSTSTTTDEKRQAVAIAADCLGQWLEYVAPDYLEDEPAPFLPAGVEVTVADVARALEVLEGMKP
jgi:hypothetical protein